MALEVQLGRDLVLDVVVEGELQVDDVDVPVIAALEVALEVELQVDVDVPVVAALEVALEVELGRDLVRSVEVEGELQVDVDVPVIAALKVALEVELQVDVDI